MQITCNLESGTKVVIWVPFSPLAISLVTIKLNFRVGNYDVTWWRLQGVSFPKVVHSIMESEVVPLDINFLGHEGLLFIKKNPLKKCKYSWMGDLLSILWYFSLITSWEEVGHVSFLQQASPSCKTVTQCLLPVQSCTSGIHQSQHPPIPPLVPSAPSPNGWCITKLVQPYFPASSYKHRLVGSNKHPTQAKTRCLLILSLTKAGHPWLLWLCFHCFLTSLLRKWKSHCREKQRDTEFPDGIWVPESMRLEGWACPFLVCLCLCQEITLSYNHAVINCYGWGYLSFANRGLKNKNYHFIKGHKTKQERSGVLVKECVWEVGQP